VNILNNRDTFVCPKGVAVEEFLLPPNCPKQSPVGLGARINKPEMRFDRYCHTKFLQEIFIDLKSQNV
jgi:hypothetical protein